MLNGLYVDEIIRLEMECLTDEHSWSVEGFANRSDENEMNLEPGKINLRTERAQIP